jgi:hypothetical protein
MNETSTLKMEVERPPKRWFPTTKLQGAATQKITTFLFLRETQITISGYMIFKTTSYSQSYVMHLDTQADITY